MAAGGGGAVVEPFSLKEAPRREVADIVEIVRAAMARKEPAENRTSTRTARLLATWLSAPSAQALVVRTGETIHGVLVFNTEPRLTRIIHLGVAEPRNGHGRMLMDYFLDLVSTLGPGEVRVAVSPIDRAHMGFFIEHYGFKQLGPADMIAGVLHHEAARTIGDLGWTAEGDAALVDRTVMLGREPQHAAPPTATPDDDSGAWSPGWTPGGPDDSARVGGASAMDATPPRYKVFAEVDPAGVADGGSITAAQEAVGATIGTEPAAPPVGAPPPEAQLPRAEACLVVTAGMALKKVTRLAERPAYYLGRDMEADIVLVGDAISRRHCVVRWEGRALLLEDLGSANGTYVNGVRVSRTFLLPQDTLKIGSTRLRLELRLPSESAAGPSGEAFFHAKTAEREVDPETVVGAREPRVAPEDEAGHLRAVVSNLQREVAERIEQAFAFESRVELAERRAAEAEERLRGGEDERARLLARVEALEKAVSTQRETLAAAAQKRDGDLRSRLRAMLGDIKGLEDTRPLRNSEALVTELEAERERLRVAIHTLTEEAGHALESLSVIRDGSRRLLASLEKRSALTGVRDALAENRRLADALEAVRGELKPSR